MWKFLWHLFSLGRLEVQVGAAFGLLVAAAGVGVIQHSFAIDPSDYWGQFCFFVPWGVVFGGMLAFNISAICGQGRWFERGWLIAIPVLAVLVYFFTSKSWFDKQYRNYPGEYFWYLALSIEASTYSALVINYASLLLVGLSVFLTKILKRQMQQGVLSRRTILLFVGGLLAAIVLVRNILGVSNIPLGDSLSLAEPNWMLAIFLAVFACLVPCALIVGIARFWIKIGLCALSYAICSLILVPWSELSFKDFRDGFLYFGFVTSFLVFLPLLGLKPERAGSSSTDTEQTSVRLPFACGYWWLIALLPLVPLVYVPLKYDIGVILQDRPCNWERARFAKIMESSGTTWEGYGDSITVIIDSPHGMYELAERWSRITVDMDVNAQIDNCTTDYDFSRSPIFDSYTISGKMNATQLAHLSRFSSHLILSDVQWVPDSVSKQRMLSVFIDHVEFECSSGHG